MLEKINKIISALTRRVYLVGIFGGLIKRTNLLIIFLNFTVIEGILQAKTIEIDDLEF